jgi:two-component system cell cycle sensor histidine kinase/response regulator CckA
MTNDPIKMKRTNQPKTVLKTDASGLESSAKLLQGGVEADAFISLQRYHNLGVLAGGLIHEFNNSMTTMLVTIGLVRKMAGLSPEQQKLLDRMQETVLKASKSTARLLDYVRPAATQLATVEINFIVREALEIIGNRIPATVTPVIELFPQKLWCRADHRQLQQAILNCLFNAVEASQSGGFLHLCTRLIKTAEAASRDKLPAALCGGDVILITIRDSGEGLPQALSADPYRPLQSDKEVGRGLGLAAAKAILEAHGGIITIEANAPRGVNLSLYLPATTQS